MHAKSTKNEPSETAADIFRLPRKYSNTAKRAIKKPPIAWWLKNEMNESLGMGEKFNKEVNCISYKEVKFHP